MSFEFFVLLKKKRIHFGWFFLRTCIIFRRKEPSINTKCYLHVIIASYKTWAQLWTERQGEIVKKVCYKFHRHFCKSLCFLLLLLFFYSFIQEAEEKNVSRNFLVAYLLHIYRAVSQCKMKKSFLHLVLHVSFYAIHYKFSIHILLLLVWHSLALPVILQTNNSDQCKWKIERKNVLKGKWKKIVTVLVTQFI